MPAGKFSEAEIGPRRAAILEFIAKQNADNALIRDALKHYAAFMHDCSRGTNEAASIANFVNRARRAETLSKEFS